jgi:hypothetical protein
LLNVGYVAAEFELQAEGLVLEGTWGETRLYLNEFARPRAWVGAVDDPLGASYRPVDELRWLPERVEVTASGPGTLVLAELAYPGWRVLVGGTPVELLAVEGLLRGVRLGPGEHEVVFVFRPVGLYFGLGLSAAALLALAGLYWRARRDG